MCTKDRVWKKVTDWLKAYNVPSVQTCVLQGDGEVISESFGYSDIKTGTKASMDTIYGIGSITKSFVAAGIVKLVSEKKLEWDQTIKYYIPEFEMHDKYVEKHLTVKDILSHNCGLPEHLYIWYKQSLTNSELLEKIKYIEPNVSFRETFQYSNIMYDLAGCLIERITHMKWYDYVEKEITKPLNLKNTYFKISEVKALDKYATPYVKKGGKIKEIAVYDYGNASSGCMSSTATDLIEWAKFNMNYLQYKEFDDNFKSEYKKVHQLHMHQSSNTNIPYYEHLGYGYGWFIDLYRGRKIVWHGGAIDGFLAMIVLIPELDEAFSFVMNNISNFNDIIVLQFILLDVIFDCDSKENEIEINKIFSEKEEGISRGKSEFLKKFEHKKALSLEINQYEGKYLNKAYGEIEIVSEEGKLYCDSVIGKLVLEHLSLNTFYMINDIPEYEDMISVEFKTSLFGEVESIGLNLEKSLNKLIYFKKRNIKS